MISENIQFYILPGFDTLSTPYKQRFNEWEKIGLQHSLLSRTELAETINKFYTETGQNNEGLYEFCKKNISKDYILRHINPEPKSQDALSISSTESNESNNPFLEMPSYSETVIYAMDETDGKILSFLIVSLEITLNLRLLLICSPHHYGAPSIKKLFEYATVMGATSIRLDSLAGTVGFYETLGFMPDTIHYSDLQLQNLKKRSKSFPMMYTIPVVKGNITKRRTRKNKGRTTKSIT
jgi:hypothetical protein